MSRPIGPDPSRRDRFRQRWRDAAVRGKKSGTLDRLAWQNLGFRLAERFGDSTDEHVDETFECFAERYGSRGRWHP